MDLKQMVLKILAGGAGGVQLLRRRANRVAPALSSKWETQLGIGQAWMPLSYGEYYPRSALVYSAIKMRQDAIVRVPLKVFSRGQAAPPDPALGPSRTEHGPRLSGTETSTMPIPRPSREAGAVPVGSDHPAQRLLDSPNPFWTRGDLWRATETYLGLWGSAYWGLERDERGQLVEIWPLRSDRMRVIPTPSGTSRGSSTSVRGSDWSPTCRRTSCGSTTSTHWTSTRGYRPSRRYACRWTWASTHCRPAGAT